MLIAWRIVSSVRGLLLELTFPGPNGDECKGSDRSCYWFNNPKSIIRGFQARQVGTSLYGPPLRTTIVVGLRSHNSSNWMTSLHRKLRKLSTKIASLELIVSTITSRQMLVLISTSFQPPTFLCYFQESGPPIRSYTFYCIMWTASLTCESLCPNLDNLDFLTEPVLRHIVIYSSTALWFCSFGTLSWYRLQASPCSWCRHW